MVKPIFVAEFTTNHLGNLNLLLKMVKSAKESGANFIKMQMKDVEHYYSDEKLNSEYKSPYGKTYRDYRTTFEFDLQQLNIFDAYCKELNIPWFATAQDEKSLRTLVENYEMPMVKIASSSSRDWEFLKSVQKIFPIDRPIVISVGGSTIDEIVNATMILDTRPLYILHCVAEYPCEPEHLRLGNIDKLLLLYKGSERIKIGYSGHEEGIEPSLLVADMGVSMIERHFCLSRHSFAHHIECSLEPQEFKNLVNFDKIDIRKTFPDVTFSESFGMSNTEKDFLVDQKYGKKYLGDESQWQEK